MEFAAAELRRLREAAIAVERRWLAVADDFAALERSATTWVHQQTFGIGALSARDEAKNLRDLIGGVDTLLQLGAFSQTDGLGVIPLVPLVVGAIAVVGGVAIYTVPDAWKYVAEQEAKASIAESQAKVAQTLAGALEKETDPKRKAEILASLGKVVDNIGQPEGWPGWVWLLIAGAIALGVTAVIAVIERRRDHG